MAWIKAAQSSDLEGRDRLLVKSDGRQVALFRMNGRWHACDNRCPHEGYPLIEGTLGPGCLLTCNWHNWKFDLSDGHTLVGGDRLRVYPVDERDGALWVDLTDPPPEDRLAWAMEGLREAFEDEDEARMARELARIGAAGGDPLQAVAKAVVWSHDRMEYGTTHAFAATADWLSLRERDARSEPERLVPLVESLLHMAEDVVGEPVFAYTTQAERYDEAALQDAIEAENEPAAQAQLNGALAEGKGFADLEPVLARAALAHYQGFGHAAIYVVKTGELACRLGPEAQAPLLRALLRYLVYTRREDLIPEFRAYAPALVAWRDGKNPPPPAESFISGSVKQVLGSIANAGAPPPALFDRLLEAAALQMLYFDLGRQDRVDGPVSQNVGWLDFTHAVTFANASRRLAERHPELWPACLLQIGCFLGRNARYLDTSLDPDEWRVADPQSFLAEARRGLFDHRESEPIVAAHLVKLLTAVSEEAARAPEDVAPVLTAAARRLLESPLRRKHALRTAAQALNFVGGAAP
ncbi:MAG: Rieske (2Fe-2S) protein [Rhodovibrionaceae bacterium]|nr:Rieske (2Fe-2S) protein [Rhodovibrionaceae bacterium]